MKASMNQWSGSNIRTEVMAAQRKDKYDWFCDVIFTLHSKEYGISGQNVACTCLTVRAKTT